MNGLLFLLTDLKVAFTAVYDFYTFHSIPPMIRTVDRELFFFFWSQILAHNFDCGLCSGLNPILSVHLSYTDHCSYNFRCVIRRTKFVLVDEIFRIEDPKDRKNWEDIRMSWKIDHISYGSFLYYVLLTSKFGSKN